MKSIIKIILVIAVLATSYFIYSQTYHYNIDKAIEHLNKHAMTKSHNCCAWYVMRAMQAGRCPIGIFPAHSYKQILPFYGFKEVNTTHYEKGDIIVFPAIKNHKWGHIAMYNGKQWISDFKQKSIIVSKGYLKAKYTVFRYSK